jgi:hypothetical protein
VSVLVGMGVPTPCVSVPSLFVKEWLVMFVGLVLIYEMAIFLNLLSSDGISYEICCVLCWEHGIVGGVL